MESRIQTVCLMALTSIGVAFALFWLRPVIDPLRVGTVRLARAFSHDRLPGRALARSAESRPARHPATRCGDFRTSLRARVDLGQIAANSAAYTLQFAQILEGIIEKIPVRLAGLVANIDFEELVKIPTGAVRYMFTNTSSALLDMISKSILVLIFVVFLTIGSGAREPSTGTWGEIEARVRRYLVVKAIISALTGLLVSTVLGVLGVPLAMVFGLFAFLLNFIPSVGSIISTLLPLPVVLVSPEISGLTAILAIALPGLIQIVIGNFMEPKIMGESLDLHPVTILLMLIFWGMLWGVVGMLLATPITAVLKILFEKLETTRPIAELLAGLVQNMRTPSHGPTG